MGIIVVPIFHPQSSTPHEVHMNFLAMIVGIPLGFFIVWLIKKFG